MPLTATLSVSMKVNLGNYEAADAFLSVGGITLETTDAEIADLLDGPVKITYDELKARMAPKIAELRARRLENK